jgi:hypothetical protein
VTSKGTPPTGPGYRKGQGGTIKSVWLRDNRKCHLCLQPVELKEASRDHIETASNGGYAGADNYRISHKRCNHARGDMPIELAYEVVRELKEAGVWLTTQIVQDALYNRLREYRQFMRAGQRHKA